MVNKWGVVIVVVCALLGFISIFEKFIVRFHRKDRKRFSTLWLASFSTCASIVIRLRMMVLGFYFAWNLKECTKSLWGGINAHNDLFAANIQQLLFFFHFKMCASTVLIYVNSNSKGRTDILTFDGNSVYRSSVYFLRWLHSEVQINLDKTTKIIMHNNLHETIRTIKPLFTHFVWKWALVLVWSQNEFDWKSYRTTKTTKFHV